jgi:hypothetical protein
MSDMKDQASEHQCGIEEKHTTSSYDTDSIHSHSHSHSHGNAEGAPQRRGEIVKTINNLKNEISNGPNRHLLATTSAKYIELLLVSDVEQTRLRGIQSLILVSI